MPEALPEAELLVLAVTSPLQAGVYVSGERVEALCYEGKTSETLPGLLADVGRRYRLGGLYYARGPGSFMAIKVAYVMLRTYALARGLPLRAADAFAFNGGRPIPAVGSSCFVKRGGEIRIERGTRCEPARPVLPTRLDPGLFSSESEPLYILPAV